MLTHRLNLSGGTKTLASKPPSFLLSSFPFLLIVRPSCIRFLRKHLHSPCFVGGMYQSAAASFHPARVAHALAEEVRKLGARIFTGTQVLSVEEERKENENSQLPSSHCYKVRTAASGEVSSTVVVHATNAWSSALSPCYSFSMNI